MSNESKIFRFRNVVCLILLSCAFAHQTASRDSNETVSLVETIREIRSLKQAGDPNGANRLLDELMATFPSPLGNTVENYAFLANEKSVVLREAGELDGSLKSAKLASKLLTEAGIKNDTLIAARINSGETYRLMGNIKEATSDLETAVELANQFGSEEIVAASRQRSASYNLELGYFSEVEALLEGLAANEHPSSLLTAELRASAFLARRLPMSAARALPKESEFTSSVSRLRHLVARTDLQLGKLQQALAELEKLEAELKGGDQTEYLLTLYSKAEALFHLGLFQEAYSANERAWQTAEKLVAVNETLLGQILHRRAVLLSKVGDPENALSQFGLAISQFSTETPKGKAAIRISMIERSRNLSSLGRHTEAIFDAYQVLSSAEEDSDVLEVDKFLATSNLGLVLLDAEKFREALKFLNLAERTAARNSFSIPETVPVLIALGEVNILVGNPDEAKRALLEALEKLNDLGALGNADLLGEAQRLLSQIYLSQGSQDGFDRAVNLSRNNVDLLLRRLNEISLTASYASQFSPITLEKQLEQALSVLMDSVQSTRTLAQEAFTVSQIAHLNETSQASNGFLKNLRESDGRLSAMLTERSKTMAELEFLTSNPNQGSIHVIDSLKTQRDWIDEKLSRDFPDIIKLIQPSTLSISEVQKMLKPDEAMWLHFAGPNSSFVFLLSHDNYRAREVKVSSSELSRLVNKVRETLDMKGRSAPAKFDFQASTTLYEHLFFPFEEVIASKPKLILIPHGAAQQISLAALTKNETSMGVTQEGADARFLGLTHSLTVYPSVSSFATARKTSKTTIKFDSFVGFGHPKLSAPRPKSLSSRGSLIELETGSVRAGVLEGLFEELPETERELELMAKAIPEAKSEIFIQESASESKYKTLDGLGKALVFATHAVVAGDFDYLREPGIVLTPPDKPSSFDDGLLTASEIVTREINAAIVILSACNTASTSGRYGAPGLSGLAKAFFGAGARSVVASHWTISTVSSLLLMPEFFEEVANGEEPGEAMRLAMIRASLRKDNPALSHPAIWAPFSVIGSY